MPIAETRLERLQLTKLLQCVHTNDRQTLEKLITNGIPNLTNYIDALSGEIALNIAAQTNADELVEFLLRLGSDPDAADISGVTAAMKAAEYGHWQTLEKLVDAGGDMQLTDKEGKGVLFYCTKSSTDRHKRCADIVLKNGANPNDVSKRGLPVFVHVCETAKENEEICRMMIEKGANLNSVDETTGKTALMAAAASGSSLVVREILDRGRRSGGGGRERGEGEEEEEAEKVDKGEFGKEEEYINRTIINSKISAVHEAAKGGHLQVLQVLSAYGCSFDVRDSQNNSPIHLAASNGHGLACRFLAQRGCNPRPKNTEGETARTLAKNAGHKEAMKECRKAEKFFGKSGKNIEPWAITLYDHIQTKEKQLMEAFEKVDVEGGDGGEGGKARGKISREDFVDVLENTLVRFPDGMDLKRILVLHETENKNIDYKEFISGKKFIHKTYSMNAYEGKKKKKKGGGGGGGRKKKGKTKILIPICTQREEDRGKDGGPGPTFINEYIHRTDDTRFNRDERPDHPIEDDSKWYLDHPKESYSYISHAVKNCDLNTIKDAVFNKRLDVNIRDKYYKTPLMIACLYGNAELIKFLVDSGANITAEDNFKWTSLHFSCHCGQSDIVEYLLDNGADIESKALNGTTPLMRAIQSNSIKVIQLLLDRGAKLRVQNRKEETPLDLAAAYADYEVYNLIKEKWEKLPVVKEKKKNSRSQKSANTSRKSTRPKSAPSIALRNLEPIENEKTKNSSYDREIHRKGSILQALSIQAGGGGTESDEKEDITYSIINTWDEVPTSRKLISDREKKRDRFGWEVDFEDFKFPFLKNVSRKTEEVA